MGLKPKEPAQQIAEYYEQVKHLYPDVSYAQFDRACRTSFKFLKAQIISGELRTVRLMYIGNFLVRKARAKGLLRKTEMMFRGGKVDIDIRNYIQGIVKNYFKREYNEDLPLEEIPKI